MTDDLPWSDPEHDVMADIGDYLRQLYEAWPAPPWEPTLPERTKDNETN